MTASENPQGGLDKPVEIARPEAAKSITVAWDICRACGGGGQQVGLSYMEPCWECDGQGTVRVRDTKGRYAKLEVST